MGSFVTGLFQNIQEQTKALVFVFVFVLVGEQAVSTVLYLDSDFQLKEKSAKYL